MLHELQMDKVFGGLACLLLSTARIRAALTVINAASDASAEVRRSLARCEDCLNIAGMPGLSWVIGLPKCLLRATGAAVGAAVASLSWSVLNKGVRLLFDRVLALDA